MEVVYDFSILTMRELMFRWSGAALEARAFKLHGGAVAHETYV